MIILFHAVRRVWDGVTDNKQDLINLKNLKGDNFKREIFQTTHFASLMREMIKWMD